MEEPNPEIAPVVEDKVTTSSDTPEVAPTVEPEKTIGDMVKETEPTPRVVDEHVFVAEKKARKAAERKLKELEETIASGGSAKEIAQITDDIEDLAEEFDVDPKFLAKLASTVKSNIAKETEQEKTQQKQKENFDTAFANAYSSALSRAPEFASISNADVIKTLSLQPQNQGKTIPQILEETYGNAISGKRTIETTTPGGGKEPEALDYDRAVKDTEYFKEVMNNPKLKAEYNDKMLKSGF